MPVSLRAATAHDLPALKLLVERAYRGDSARRGWTHEADLVTGERIGRDELATLLEGESGRVLVAVAGGALAGCVHIADQGHGLAYLGLLCVDPGRQAQGIGARLIAFAEETARRTFGARAIEMTVIDRRGELIDYYLRRGYIRSGETRPFPVPLDPPLGMSVLVKPLDSAQEA